MKIKVIGKAHREGHSQRTGRDYNFNQIHFNAPDRGVEGLAAQTIMLDPGMYPFDAIKVGGEYEVEYGPRGIVGFSEVK